MGELNFYRSVDELGEFSALKGCKSVAVKLHMGEKGSTSYIKPDIIKEIVVHLPSGTEPFLFDSTTMYDVARHTVEDYERTAQGHGFDKIGIPIVISNDGVEYESKSFPVQVCKPLVEADGVLVLSHVKGHRAAGFGGAIKNMGMGCVTSSVKKAIHDGGGPAYESGCTLCGICASVCPLECIGYTDKPDFSGCWLGCSKCVMSCPQKVLKPKIGFFDNLLAEAASVAFKSFKKSYFVNILFNITEMCDCWPEPSKTLTPDIGILSGSDPVAIDKASVDMVNEQSGKDLFNEASDKSPLLHIEAASRYGMGSSECTLA